MTRVDCPVNVSAKLGDYTCPPSSVIVIKQNQWHNIVVSEDAKILIVENADIGKENTEYIEFGYEMVK